MHGYHVVSEHHRRIPWPGARQSRAPSDRGMLVIVVGSSGAGKDSLLANARRFFSADDDLHFVRRVVTRVASDAGEPHESVSEERFLQRKALGEFVIDWQAHGLSYGIPASCIDALYRNQLVVVNGSREALPRFAVLFPRRFIVHVVVPAETLKERLLARGREEGDAVERRLLRRIDPTEFDGPVWKLDNGGTLEASSKRFIQWLDALRNERLTLPGR